MLQSWVDMNDDRTFNLSSKVPQIGRGQSFSYLSSITKEYAQLRVRLDGNFRLTSSIFMWFVTHFCSNTLTDTIILVGGGPDSFSDRNEIPLDKVYNYPLYKTVATYNLQSKYLYRCTFCQRTIDKSFNPNKQRSKFWREKALKTIRNFATVAEIMGILDLENP